MSKFIWGHETEERDATGTRIEQAIVIVAIILVAGCIAATGMMMWQKATTSKVRYIDSQTELVFFKELRKERVACQAGKKEPLVSCGETNQRFEQIEQSMKNWKDSAK